MRPIMNFAFKDRAFLTVPSICHCLYCDGSSTFASVPIEALSHCYYKGVSYLNMLTVNIKSPVLPILHHSCLKCWSISLAFIEESHITGRNLLFASMLFRLSDSDAVWISEAGLQSLTVCVCKHNLPEMQCNSLQITGVTHCLFVCLNPQHTA